MQVNIKYSFSDENEALMEQINEYFRSLGMESRIHEKRVFAEKTFFNLSEDEPAETYFLRKAVNDCKNLYDILKRGFTLTGVIDTSYAAGECADFALACKDGQVTAQLSDWYVETCMEDYECYEDFSDGFFECTEEEYNELKDNEFVYLLETDHGDVLSAVVPLHDVKVD